MYFVILNISIKLKFLGVRFINIYFYSHLNTYKRQCSPIIYNFIFDIIMNIQDICGSAFCKFVYISIFDTFSAVKMNCESEILIKNVNPVFTTSSQRICQS